MPSVTVVINGKNYRMACDDGQEKHLMSLASTFDGYVDQLKGSFGEIGDQRLTVMAGVMVTDELLELKKKVAKLEKQAENANSSKEKALNKVGEVESGFAAEIVAAAGKLEAIAERLKLDQS